MQTVLGLPSIEVESNAGIREIPLPTHYLKTRKVFLLGEINSESISHLVMQLLFLESESCEVINLYINSPGGEVNAGLMLYDVLQGMQSPVNIYCMGMAASMAAIILASGIKGRRYILPHSKVMIHEPLINGGFGGSATSIKNISENILETKKLLNEILAKHTGRTVEEVDTATAFDHYMTAEEAIDFGICDKITMSLN